MDLFAEHSGKAAMNTTKFAPHRVMKSCHQWKVEI
jgi:hypothetical protein